MFYTENAVYGPHNSHIETPKRIQIHYDQWVKTLKSAFYHDHTARSIMKLT